MTTLFVSDLHIDPARPEIGAQFIRFLGNEAPTAEALYILGDLFETWIGDDDPDPEKHRIVAALAELTAAGIRGYVMHGNRDFLIGERFCKETGLTFLEDGSLVNLYGEAVLLMHGDTLCTDDVEYQQLRRMVRNPVWQADFLARGIEERLAVAADVRERSRAATMLKATEIMDVNQQAVAQLMRERGVRSLVHGHTHRPAVHRFELDGRHCRRIVLGDWHAQGSVLRWDARGPELESRPR